jgi:phage gp46-like protein
VTIPAEYSWSVGEIVPPVEEPLSGNGEGYDLVGDIGLYWSDNSSSVDLNLYQNDLAKDAGLATAISIALFTDRLLPDGVILPLGQSDRAGWWGDASPPTDGDLIGSRLWSLSREKISKNILRQAETLAREALQWLLDDGIAASLAVSAVALASGIGLAIEILRPTTTEKSKFKFDLTWGGI